MSPDTTLTHEYRLGHEFPRATSARAGAAPTSERANTATIANQSVHYGWVRAAPWPTDMRFWGVQSGQSMKDMPGMMHINLIYILPEESANRPTSQHDSRTCAAGTSVRHLGTGQTLRTANGVPIGATHRPQLRSIWQPAAIR